MWLCRILNAVYTPTPCARWRTTWFRWRIKSIPIILNVYGQLAIPILYIKLRTVCTPKCTHVTYKLRSFTIALHVPKRDKFLLHRDWHHPLCMTMMIDSAVMGRWGGQNVPFWYDLLVFWPGFWMWRYNEGMCYPSKVWSNFRSTLKTPKI